MSPSNGADSTGMVAFSPARDNEEILRVKHFQRPWISCRTLRNATSSAQIAYLQESTSKYRNLAE